MHAVAMEPQVLIDILVGAKKGVIYNFTTEHRGDLLVTSYALKEAGLPSSMAGAVVQLEEIEETEDGYIWKFNPEVTLIRPFKVRGTMEMFDIEDDLIKPEPTNWFNIEQENAGHEKINAWIESYLADHPEIDYIPRADIPDEIADLASSFDDWRETYLKMIYAPTKDQKKEFRQKRYDVEAK
ncbi:hypothetical protein ACRHK7_05650 [Weissella tructae]|uniref:Uncharacterized protein n=2 Tax=Weissella TaxID=46255 RepID=A0A075U0E6_9LACO|nr:MULTISPECIES: hypothetical protein [Weissella]AIG65673.1 hypothetical protein WS08_0734 [Weissella tructae]AIM62988.1 hypothetical protein WS74_0736 [Weissella ceti]AIM64387.1 hypothetical protein WS105_0797 [Weissella ceti]ELA06873.1 hypothetical protein WCNC_04817 [Weissella ceti NC36]QVV90793.1 hypothetical protein KHQ32_03930 [Weissella tructae]